VKIACVGGGPAGLYFGILMRQRLPAAQVTVWERNQPDDTFGFGVVFSDATLGRLAAADPPSHRAVTDAFARWDDIELHVGGQVLRSTGHGFCGLERRTLLRILQARAAELGVDVRFGAEVARLADAGPADLFVVGDGVASGIRSQHALAFGPDVDVRPNKFVWLGTTAPLAAFTFHFVETAIGLLRVHAYPFARDRSTFIVECTEDTWRRGGFEHADEATTVLQLQRLLAAQLGGHPLLANRSIWRNFPTVRCASWGAATPDGPAVLVGDAAHTAHYSIGSGTKLAMEDVIALVDELVAGRPTTPADMLACLGRYEATRKPGVESLQAAAQASLQWFEHTERYRRLPPAQFAYSLMTRSLRVDHASMRKRDPALCRAVETEVLGGGAGRPSEQPVDVFSPPLSSRLAVEVPRALAPRCDDGVPGDRHLARYGGLAERGAALLITEPMSAEQDLAVAGIFTDEQVVGWRRVLELVRDVSAAACAAQLEVQAEAPAAHVEGVWRAEFAGFDALVLALPAGLAAEAAQLAVRATRRRWPAPRPLVVRLELQPELVAYVEPLRQLGASHAWIVGEDAAGVVLAAEAVRLEAQLPVLLSLPPGARVEPDVVDALICGARADVLVLPRAPTELGWGPT
jgi:anthraniloyl-CoA monooxygenase